MSLVDSLDSILMLYAYAMPDSDPEGRLALFEDRKTPSTPSDLDPTPIVLGTVETAEEHVEEHEEDVDKARTEKLAKAVLHRELGEQAEPSGRAQRVLNTKARTMSTLSILLTIISILVALRYVPYLGFLVCTY